MSKNEKKMCHLCDKEIDERYSWITTKNGYAHKECFVCGKCKERIITLHFTAIGSSYYCNACMTYDPYARKSQKCQDCGELVYESSVTTYNNAPICLSCKERKLAGLGKKKFNLKGFVKNQRRISQVNSSEAKKPEEKKQEEKKVEETSSSNESNDDLDKIEKLHNLWKKGIISEQEYIAGKKKILGI